MAARTRRRRAAPTVAALAAVVATLGACGDIDLPDITAPDVTLPTITRPDITLPTFTPPDITLPTLTPPDITLPTFPGGGGGETPTAGVTPTESATPTVTVTATGPGETVTATGPAETVTETGAGETVTETVPATAGETTEPAPAPEEDTDEDGGWPWWVWLLLAGALAILAGVLYARRRASAKVYEAWAGRVQGAGDRFAGVQPILARPSTLDPADHQDVRHAVAEARDLSVTFSRLADSAPDEILAQQAEDTADRLRTLATAAEIENEGLAQRQLVSLAERQAAEDRRLAALRVTEGSLDELLDRLHD